MRLLIGLVCLTLPAFSQSGSLSGTVVDALGNAVANANVQARGAGTPQSVTTAGDGKYSFAALPVGTYDIAVAGVPSMSNFERKGVAIAAAKAVTLDIRLLENTQLGTLGEDRLGATDNLRRHNPPNGPTPRTKDGKPDLSGVWWSPRVVDGGNPQFLASAEAVARQRLADNRKDSPQSHCLPAAVTRFGPLIEFVQGNDTLVAISDDDSPGFHKIYLDGRAHPADPNPSWYGHNTGQWDGDTLVVDRVAFNDRVWLDQELHPHSSRLHVVERFRRPVLGQLEIETTVNDPEVVSKPYTIKRVSDLAQGYSIDEFICTENERDVPHLLGK